MVWRVSPPQENAMTPLDKALKRQLVIDGKSYTLSLDAEGFKLTEKGRRLGINVAWKDVVNGDAALASALNASTEGL
jgi:hypothetical protein